MSIYPYAKINETIVHTPDIDEPTVIHRQQVTHTNNEQEKHLMLVARSDIPATTPEDEESGLTYNLSEPRNSPLHTRITMQTAPEAIRQHLQNLEIHGCDEDEMLSELHDSPIITADDIATATEQTRKDRAKTLITRSKAMMDRYDRDRIRLFLTNGDWRDTDPGEESLTTATALLESVEVNTQACYRNAALLLEYAYYRDDIDESRVTYHEGLSMTKYGNIPNEHAWVEIDGSVLEVTWPWSGWTPPETAVYYGIELDWAEARETMLNRPTFASVLVSDATYYSMSSVQHAIKVQQERHGGIAPVGGMSPRPDV